MTASAVASPTRAASTTRRFRGTNRLDATLRTAFLGLLDRSSEAALTIRDDHGVTTVGSPPPDLAVPTVTIRSGAAWRSLAAGGSVGLGEAFMDERWETDDLVATLRMLIRALGPLDRWRDRLHRTHAPLSDAIRRRARPTARTDRRNISAHYDLSNDFFELFLDETMMYSSGIFETPKTALQDASTAKLDRICRIIDLGPNDHVLEIGTGWGGFAVHAAQRTGARVTTTTISEQQFDYARKRVAEEGLTDRIDVRFDDYRDLEGRFSKLVSIEMIEAVDWRHHDTFFAACERLLADDGLMALQAILIADQRYERAKHTRDFIKRFVFPGGCLPSLTAIASSLTRATNLRITDLSDIGPHYATTLHRWGENIATNREKLLALGFDHRFARLWEFYLAYCEAAFLERHVSVTQMVLAAPAWRSSINRGGPHDI